MDKYEKKELTNKKTIATSSISCGITWFDGRIIFKDTKYFDRQGRFYYGICHFSNGIFVVTPLDHQLPTMLTTIMVSPTEGYCERAFSCIDIDCKLNKHDRGMFEKDIGDFAKEFPRFKENKPYWFNNKEYRNYWGKHKIAVNGGILRYKEEE
jgi:hypothetical protein